MLKQPGRQWRWCTPVYQQWNSLLLLPLPCSSRCRRQNILPEYSCCGPLRAWWLMLKADYYLHWANGVLAFSSSLLPTPQKPHLVIGIYKLKILAIAPNCLLRKERGPVHSFLLLLLGTFTTTITTTTTRWGLMAMGEYSIWRKILVC